MSPQSVGDHPSPAPPPRILIVMGAQWPRANLRAALRHVGYDAVGAPTLAEAMSVPAAEPARGPVRLILVDQSALHDAGSDVLLERLLAAHAAPAAVLIAPATVETHAGAWRRVLRRPVSIDEIVTAVDALLPLPAPARRPLD